MISARIPKGFHDSLPKDEYRRQSLISSIRNTCFLMGYMPIDTPTLEFSEILLGKGGGETDKQVYSFVDPGGRSLSLRYDLTVPLARFISQHKQDIVMPFRRFHVGKVFRGEKPQKGRYREFYQCDWDLIAESSLWGDWEVLHSILVVLDALTIPDYHVSFSHRGILPCFLKKLAIEDSHSELLRIIDKRTKIGDKACLELLENTIGKEKASPLLRLITKGASNADTFDQLQEYLSEELKDYMREIFSLIDTSEYTNRILFDPSITRGLDYYTGIVFETFFDKLPRIGSICSGGRYDNLAALYGGSDMPGVGASIGLDRLLAGLDETSSAQSSISSKHVLVCYEHTTSVSLSQTYLRTLRAQGIVAEQYPSEKTLKKQFLYAEKSNIPFVLRFDDADNGILKHLATAQTISVSDPQQLFPFIETYAESR